MQIVQHIMSLMESSIGKLQYSDSDLFGLQKLDPRKSLKRIPLANYEYGAKRRKGYAFETAKNHDSADDAPDFKNDYSLKRAPTIPLETFEDTETRFWKTSCGFFQVTFSSRCVLSFPSST